MRKSDFIKYRPKITEVTVVEAAQAWGVGDEARELCALLLAEGFGPPTT
jgi:hypothetical protein